MPLEKTRSLLHTAVTKNNSHPIAIAREHLTCAMSINAYSSQKLENLEPDHKEK